MFFQIFQVSDEEISATYLRYELSHRQKLNSFYQLRSLFAPLIEGLVLLDRLIFLREQVNPHFRSNPLKGNLEILEICHQYHHSIIVLTILVILRFAGSLKMLSNNNPYWVVVMCCTFKASSPTHDKSQTYLNLLHIIWFLSFVLFITINTSHTWRLGGVRGFCDVHENMTRDKESKMPN